VSCKLWLCASPLVCSFPCPTTCGHVACTCAHGVKRACLQGCRALRAPNETLCFFLPRRVHDQFFLRGLKLIQGRYRGQMARKVFSMLYSKIYRPFKLRLVDATFAGSSSMFAPLASEPSHSETGIAATGRPIDGSAFITLFKRPAGSPHLLESFNGLLYEDEIPPQCYRIDSSPTRVEEHCSSRKEFQLRWSNEAHLIICCTALSQAVITVVLAPKHPQEHEHGVVEFVGQAVLDLCPCLFRSSKSTVEVDFGPVCSLPLDTKTLKPTRLHGVEEHMRGKVTVQIEPFSTDVTQCGFLSEVSSAVSRSKPKKRWWVVLVEQSLKLLIREGDTKPKVVISLRAASVKLHRARIVEVRAGGDAARYFLADHRDEQLKWFRKLSMIIKRHSRVEKPASDVGK